MPDTTTNTNNPTTSATIKAQCHCAAITLTAPQPSSKLYECPCSVCFRYGVIWAYYPLDQVVITKDDNVSTQSYAWGKQNIEFHFCARCGGLMYWWPTDAARIPQMAINARMLGSKEGLEGMVESGGKFLAFSFLFCMLREGLIWAVDVQS